MNPLLSLTPAEHVAQCVRIDARVDESHALQIHLDSKAQRQARLDLTILQDAGKDCLNNSSIARLPLSRSVRVPVPVKCAWVMRGAVEPLAGVQADAVQRSHESRS